MLDFSRDLRGRTVTNAIITKGGTFLDPFKTCTLTNGIDLYECRIKEITLDLGAHVTLTPSAV